MTAISQRISNFLGGVSQQSDEKLFPGQLKSAINCYPDTTLGLIKRPGGKFLGMLENITPLTSDDAFWGDIFRDDKEKYIFKVEKDGTVKVWDILTGTEKTVAYQAGKESLIKSYLAATSATAIKSLTLNDFTFILNSTKVVEAMPKPTFTKGKQAIIVFHFIEFATKYKVTVGATTYEAESRTNYVTGSPPPEVKPITLAEVVNAVSDKITVDAVAGPVLAKEIIDNTIILTLKDTTTVTAEAGPDGKYLRVIQGSVDSFNRLPEQSKHGYIVKVSGTTADKDDFYLEFKAENTVYNSDGSVKTAGSGKGVWEETRSPEVSPGMKAETLPVVMLRMPNGSFKITFLDGSETVNTLPLAWEDRLVGDDVSNSHPSFVGRTIRDMFLFSNRLGFLTEDNVSMSQAGDYYNFYHKSATTQGGADPIDLSCSSIRPAVVHSVIPIPQGLLLFSRDQQFLMEAENGAWSPATVSIRTISSYECDPDLKPADLSSTVMFVSKNQSYSRAFEIFTRGQRESPTVTESTKPVPEWIPKSLTRTIGNSQNGLWVGSCRTSDTMYLFRYYEEGDERKLASWFTWKMPGNVVHTTIQNDVLYVIVSDVRGYSILAHPLVLSPSTGGLVNSLGNIVDPYFDCWQEITALVSLDNASTKVYIPTNYNVAANMAYVVGLSKDHTQPRYCGLTNTITVKSDAGGSYFEIPGDVTNNHIYMGYSFGMEIELPRYLYTNANEGQDFTGYTTTARMQFYTGLGGAVYFSIHDNTRKDWKDISGIRVANVYSANTSPFRDHFIYKVPVYQRPDNYTMKVLSDNPFPVSLVAMQWEGQYSPGFYRRA